jgi:hypothetical protein
MAVAARRIIMLFCDDQIDSANIFRMLTDIDIYEFAPYSADRMTTIALTLAVDDDRLARIRDQLGGKVIDWSEQPALLYDANELDSAPLFWLTTALILPDGAEIRRDRQIELGVGCPHCGTGAAAAATLMLRESDIPDSTSLFNTTDGETLMSSALLEFLRPLIGASTRLTQAVRFPDYAPIPWWQVVPLVTLPPMARESRGLTRTSIGPRQPCPVCRRDAHFLTGEAVEIRYSATSLDVAQLPDIAASWERIGYSSIELPGDGIHLAPPLLIVSQRVRHVITAHGSPEIELYPIYISSSALVTTGDME